jgi:hypothetical protein
MDAIERRIEGCMTAGCALVGVVFLAWVIVTVVAAQLHLVVTPGLFILGVIACIGLGSTASGGKRKTARPDAGPTEGGDTGAPLPPSAPRKSASPYRELRELAACRKEGLITQEEFDRARAGLLGYPEPTPQPKPRRRFG